MRAYALVTVPGRAEQHLAHLCWSQRPAEVFHQACIVHRQLGHSPFLPAIGSPGLLWISIGALLYASLGLGYLIGAVSHTENQAVQLAMLSLIASTFFGGFFIALEQLQPFAQALSYLLPVSYGIRDLQDVMLRGATPPPQSLLAPLVLGFAFYLIASLIYRRQLRTS